MRQVRAIAADAGGDRLAGFRMRADLAREAQQLDRPFQVEFRQVLGDRGALRILALAHLNVWPEAAGLAVDFEAAGGVRTHRLILAILPLAVRLAEFAAEIALGIIHAGDERAVAPAAQRQAAAGPALGHALRA